MHVFHLVSLPPSLAISGIRSRNFNLIRIMTLSRAVRGGSLIAEPLFATAQVNHFPGTWELGRKDHLYKHLAAAARRHPQQFDFLPSVFLLPEDHCKPFAIIPIQVPDNI